jgi:hypothetical protein
MVLGTVLVYRRDLDLFAYAAVALAICAVPVVSGGISHSVPRYAMLAFPAFAGLSARLGRRATMALVLLFAIGQVVFVGWVIPVRGAQAP